MVLICARCQAVPRPLGQAQILDRVVQVGRPGGGVCDRFELEVPGDVLADRGCGPRASPDPPPGRADAEAGRPDIDVADQRRLDEGEAVADVAQLAERNPMGDDQQDTVGLSGNAEGVGGRQERWRIDQHEVEHLPDGAHRVAHVHSTVGTRRMPGSVGFEATGRTMPLSVDTSRSMYSLAPTGSPRRHGRPCGHCAQRRPGRGRRVQRGAACARPRRSAGSSGSPAMRRSRSAARWRSCCRPARRSSLRSTFRRLRPARAPSRRR